MVERPDKELRFTRIAQARLFLILAALLIVATTTYYGIARTAEDSPLPHWPAIIPASLALLCLPLAWHCARHAFLILSPVGIEIFPFIRPATNFRLIPWQEFHSAEVTGKLLRIHHNAEQNSGIIISLSPLDQSRRLLLAHAIAGRMKERLPQ